MGQTGQTGVLSVAMAMPAVFAKVAGDKRDVVRCDHCRLVQFLTNSFSCRRCHKSFCVQEDKEIVVEEKTVSKQTTRSTFNSQFLAGELRNRRKILRLSQRQLAELMGCPRTYVSKIENAKAVPTLTSLCRFATCLKTSPSRLLNRTSTFVPTRDEIALVKSLRTLSVEERKQKEDGILLLLSRKVPNNVH